MYRWVPTCTGGYRRVSVCTIVNSSVSVASGVYRCVPDCTDLYRWVPAYTGLFWPVPVCTGLYWWVPARIVVYRYVPTCKLCTGVYRYVPTCTSMYRRVPICTGVYGMYLCVQVCSLQTCTGMYRRTVIRSGIGPHVETDADIEDDCPASLCSFTPLSEDEVSKLIVSLSNASCDNGPIPTSLVREHLDMMLPTITRIVNSSLDCGVFRLALKSATVCPLLNKSTLDPEQLKSYRPV